MACDDCNRRMKTGRSFRRRRGGESKGERRGGMEGHLLLPLFRGRQLPIMGAEKSQVPYSGLRMNDSFVLRSMSKDKSKPG